MERDSVTQGLILVGVSGGLLRGWDHRQSTPLVELGRFRPFQLPTCSSVGMTKNAFSGFLFFWVFVFFLGFLCGFLGYFLKAKL